jgi:hypothetical protein
MDKAQLASYLVNLNSIVEAQDKGANPRSHALGREYDRHFTKLKELIQKEEEDEARKS